MALLALAGIDVPIASGSWSAGYEFDGRAGGGGAAGLGTPHLKRMYRTAEFSLVPCSQYDAEAWVALITGRGSSWTFDVDTYSEQGGGATLGGSAARSTAWGAAGSPASLKLPHATSGTADLLAIPGSRWTCWYWRKYSSTVKHYVHRSDSAKWVDGSRNDAASTPWFSGSSSASGVTLAFSRDTVNSVDHYVDEICFIPALCPTDWPAALYAVGSTSADAAAPRFPSVPVTDCDGWNYGITRATSGYNYMSLTGELRSSEVVACYLSGAWTTTAERLSFKVEEV